MASLPDRLRGWLRPSGPKIAVALSVVAAIAYTSSFSRGRPESTALGRLEGRALDFKFLLRGPIEPSGHVVVVAIDEASLATFGRWPWPRGVMADLVEGLTEAGARVIALDMAFTEPIPSQHFAAITEAHARYVSARDGTAVETTGTPQVEGAGFPEFEAWLEAQIAAGSDDHRLSQAIFESGRVVWGLFGHEREGSGPDQALLAAAFSRIRPFSVDRFFVADGDGREGRDPVPVNDADLRLLDMQGGFEAPLPEFSAATPFFGFVNVHVDPDGVIRRGHVLARHEDVLVPSFALTSVAAWLGSQIYPVRDEVYAGSLGRVRLRVRSAPSQGTFIRDEFGAVEWTRVRPAGSPVGDWEAPHLARFASWRERQVAAGVTDIDAITLPGLEPEDVVQVPLDPVQRGRLMINHIGRMEDFAWVSAVDVIEGRVSAEALAGKIAVVGVTAVGTFDQRVTPYDRMLPGVFVQASLMDAMITGRHLRRPWWVPKLEVLLLLGIGVVVGLVMPRMTGGLGIAVFLVGGLVLLGGLSLALFVWARIDLATFTPLATFLLLASTVAIFQWMVVDKEKRHVRRAFQHYLAPSVLESVLEDPKKLALEPDKAELSVLFSDIRGFTTISERLPPEQLAIVLNTYLTPMTKIVFDHGGTLDKYMGDAIMAFWGDPVPQWDHALRACQAAVEMQKQCLAMAEEFVARGWPPIEIGIGVNTGHMSVGNFGSDVLFDYTVMGDAVNLASRLEGINKEYGTRIILSEFTLAKVKDDVVARELDAVRVKGKREPVRIFELLAVGQPSEADVAFLDAFAEALAYYKRQLWDEAIEAFEACAKQRPDDVPSQIYISRCRSMKARPPGPDWDGVYTMKTK
jgi:class 3 adenylate cyclase/CHASE2 domain-containing sensor protein